MIDRGLVDGPELLQALEDIEATLLRYPSLDADAFEERVRGFVDSLDA